MSARQAVIPPAKSNGLQSTNAACRPAKAINVCAVIVTYNGGALISKVVAAISNQVDYFLFVDNHSDEATLTELARIQAAYPSKTRTIFNDTNRGIAAALNQGVKFAKDNEFEWLLTLDQDTSANSDLVAKLLKAWDSRPDRDQIAIVAPRSIFLSDIPLEKPTVDKSPRLREVELIHTSGNLVRTSVFDVVGCFREEFFIDQVDYEFCFRLRTAGFKIVLDSDAVVYHRPGDLRRRKFLSRQLYSSNHSALRRYYIARNGIVLSRESKSWRFFRGHATLLFKESLKVLLYETNKLEKLRLTLRGIADGVLNKLGELAYKGTV